MKKAIGIDLGTTNSVIAFKDTTTRVIRNNEGEELTRSCIGLINDDFVVGRTAYKTLRRDPINTVLSVKRLMGGAIKDEMVQKMSANPYYKYEITSLQGGTDDGVAIILGGKQYTPEQLSSEILKKLKADAEDKLNDEVTHAVITVPAYFTEKQKNATRIAAQLSGLKVQKLLAEPTAAAISYGVDNLKPGDATTVLIYDFGGGTFDLSILNIVDGQYMEAGTGGDRWLGGDDIDKALQSYILEKVSEEYNIEDVDSLIENLADRKKIQFEAQLREEVESVKIELSSSPNASLIMDGLEDENGEWIDFDIVITRVEFEKLVRPFVEKTIDLIDALFKEVGYDISIIDNILLVGGTSCIPLVKEMLSDKYGSGKVKSSEKPMLAISQGAGVLSHRMGDEYEPPIEGEFAISEISYSTNHNYFIELKDDYDKIVEKQMPLPCNTLRSYHTTVENQKIVQVGVYADVERGEKEKQTMGFFTIESDLPIGSEVILDITLGIDELFEIKAYSKNDKHNIRKIVLSRGNKDAKTLEHLSYSLEKVLSNNYDRFQKEFFLNSIKKEIEQINSMGVDSYDSDQWAQIGAKIFSLVEETEEVTDSFDEDEFAKTVALVLVNEYSDLISSVNIERIKTLLVQTESNDVFEKQEALKELQNFRKQYGLLITLFTVKIASNKAADKNPSEAHQLLQMHGEIVMFFKNGQKDEAHKLLDKAVNIGDKYFAEGEIAGGIHLGKIRR